MKKTLDSTILPSAKADPNFDSFQVLDLQAGVRLDTFVCLVVPVLSLRQARRAIEAGKVIIDDRSRPKGYHVRAGQIVRILRGPLSLKSIPSEPTGSVFVVAQNDDYAALFKPAGLHSESHGNSLEQGVDAFLPYLLPKRHGALLNRLDLETSGLVLVGLSVQAEDAYREWQDLGKVRKFYLLMVQGHLAGTLRLKHKIDSAKRRKVKVFTEEADEVLRFTEVTPIRFFPESSTTLCRAMILKGQRHQIRAHMSHAGHPIVGDQMYGGQNDGRKTLHLHHERIELPGFAAECPAPWIDPESKRALISFDKLTR